MKQIDKVDYKELFPCQGGHCSHAVGVAVYPSLGMEEIYVEWWTTSGGEWDNWWERIKAAWKILREGRYCTHDVILYPDDADKMADALIEAGNLGRQAKEIEAKIDADFKANLQELKEKGQINES
jgi:hypothetical protein